MKKCSLTSAKHVVIDEQIYCIKNNGNMNYSKALNFCKKQKATLPLPSSLLEFEVFYNFSGTNKTWIGVSDPLRSRKKESWIEFLNNQPVYIK